MKIYLTHGTGTGPTALAAFDAALVTAGVANYNLIRLSSVIPPDSQIIGPAKAENLPGGWGDRLYVVMAEQRAVVKNTEAWAGVGWIQDDTGAGLFVEHEGDAKGTVEKDLKDTLLGLMANRGMNPDDYEIHTHVTGITCQDHPVAALVIAVYQAADWKS